MGNSYSQRAVSSPPQPGEWIPVGDAGYCHLVVNTLTGVQAEQYYIPQDHRLTLDDNLEIYQQRRTQNDNLVTVYLVEKEGNRFICQGGEFLSVKTERVPYRLSETSNLSFPQALYILREAVIGFRAITGVYGPVLVNDEMIGFTNDNRVKVWLNEEFAQNLPKENRHSSTQHTQPFVTQPSSIEQKVPQTISQLFDVVEEHCDNGQFPEIFSRAYLQYPIQTFTETLEFIEDFAQRRGIKLKESMSCHGNTSQITDFSSNSNVMVFQSNSGPSSRVIKSRTESQLSPREVRQVAKPDSQYFVSEINPQRRIDCPREILPIDNRTLTRPRLHHFPPPAPRKEVEGITVQKYIPASKYKIPKDEKLSFGSIKYIRTPRPEMRTIQHEHSLLSQDYKFKGTNSVLHINSTLRPNHNANLRGNNKELSIVQSLTPAHSSKKGFRFCSPNQAILGSPSFPQKSIKVLQKPRDLGRDKSQSKEPEGRSPLAQKLADCSPRVLSFKYPENKGPRLLHKRVS